MSKTYPVKVDNCDGCPAIHYKAKRHIECGQPYCKKEKRNIEDEENIPDWCPLSVWHGESKSEWQPIETAPKDTKNKVEYVLITDGHLPDLVVWHGERPERTVNGNKCLAIPEGWFVCSGSRSRILNPTHWMPLPSPPQEK